MKQKALGIIFLLLLLSSCYLPGLSEPRFQNPYDPQGPFPVVESTNPEQDQDFSGFSPPSRLIIRFHRSLDTAAFSLNQDVTLKDDSGEAAKLIDPTWDEDNRVLILNIDGTLAGGKTWTLKIPRAEIQDAEFQTELFEDLILNFKT